MVWWPELAIFALALAFTLPGARLRDAVDPQDY
jgi:ABC-type dipeptide/oligopeptide/nickel transport system permease subunit